MKCLFGCFFFYSFNYFLFFQFPTGSTVILSVFPVHIAIKQIRPHLRSAVCRSTQFIMYTNNKQLSMVSLLLSALLNVNCAEHI